MYTYTIIDDISHCRMLSVISADDITETYSILLILYFTHFLI